MFTHGKIKNHSLKCCCNRNSTLGHNNIWTSNSADIFAALSVLCQIESARTRLLASLNWPLIRFFKRCFRGLGCDFTYWIYSDRDQHLVPSWHNWRSPQSHSLIDVWCNFLFTSIQMHKKVFITKRRRFSRARGPLRSDIFIRHQKAQQRRRRKKQKSDSRAPSNSDCFQLTSIGPNLRLRHILVQWKFFFSLFPSCRHG